MKTHVNDDQPPATQGERRAHSQAEHAQGQQAHFQAPASIRAEHAEIHAGLESTSKAPGAVGATARELIKILHPHIVREEQFALPPLGLLAPLAMGKYSADMLGALEMTDALRSELPQMLREHEGIAAIAHRLDEVARQVGNLDAERVAQALLAHAKAEEEVFYPAAVLVGEVLRARKGSR